MRATSLQELSSAEKLNLSIHTVKTHLRNMLTKTGAVNGSHLASLRSTMTGEETQGETP